VEKEEREGERKGCSTDRRREGKGKVGAGWNE